MKTHSSIVTILNKDVMTDAEFARARKEYAALVAVAEAADEILKDSKLGGLPHSAHCKLSFTLGRPLSDALAALATIRSNP